MPDVWKIIKEVSTQPIRQEAERPFLIGIAGTPAFIDAVILGLMGSEATPQEMLLAEARLVRAPTPSGVEAIAVLSRCDVVLAGEDAPEPSRIRPAEVIPVADPGRAPQLLLERRNTWQLALARHFPGLRPLVANHIIQDHSRANAQIAIATALPAAVPVLGWILGPALRGDVFLLTKNQAMMIIRLAAAHGRVPELRARLKEVLPVIGGALGWRTLARELVSLVPGGVGVALKAAIAFTGTYATGRAAVFYYTVGRQPTRIEMRRIRREGAVKARSAVREALESLRRQ